MRAHFSEISEKSSPPLRNLGEVDGCRNPVYFTRVLYPGELAFLSRAERLSRAGLLTFEEPAWSALSSEFSELKVAAISATLSRQPENATHYCLGCCAPLTNGSLVCGDEDSECADAWWAIVPTKSGKLWVPAS